MGRLTRKEKQSKSLALKWIKMLGHIGSNIRTDAVHKLWQGRDRTIDELWARHSAPSGTSGRNWCPELLLNKHAIWLNDSSGKTFRIQPCCGHLKGGKKIKKEVKIVVAELEQHLRSQEGHAAQSLGAGLNGECS